MQRKEIIQKLINETNAKSYVEIGLGDGKLFQEIECQKKYGIDPQYEDYVFNKGTQCDIEPTHKMTSDEFFKQNEEKFDIIFIDGMHDQHYVERDINNSLKVLNDKGFIVCHDINPTSKKMQKVPRRQNEWTGNCWKAWVKIRSRNPNINMCVVDTDYGCGIIKKGKQELLDLEGLKITWYNFKRNRKKWLNLISVEEFLNKTPTLNK